MGETGTYEKVKDRQGLISKIQNALLGGYAVKEDLRELDKMLRDSYYDDLREFRYRWQSVYLEALESGQSALGRHFKRVIQTLERVSEQIHRGDYGYAGVFDRKGSIRETQLAQVYEHDKKLAGEISQLGDAIEEVHSSGMEGNWEAVPAQINTVRDYLQGVEARWKERETIFRSLEV